MESNGHPGCIHASWASVRLLPGEPWQHTGGIIAKGGCCQGWKGGWVGGEDVVSVRLLPGEPWQHTGGIIAKGGWVMC